MDSNKIISYLESHPLLKPASIEKLIGIPSGTIRMDKSRDIPKKYIWPITFVLKKYGLRK